MKILVVGGSASNVGKTALAEFVVARERSFGRTVAIKISVRETPCELSVCVLSDPAQAEHRRDSARLLEAGAEAVIWVTVHRPNVRTALKAALLEARAMRPKSVVIESTSAGIEMRRIDDSFFIAGEGEWKPWADRHRIRADHILTTRAVLELIGAPLAEAVH